MTSLCMIVAALVEFAIVLILKYHPGKTEFQTQYEAEKGEPRSTTKVSVLGFGMDDPVTCKQDVLTENQSPKGTTHERIDHACFRIFPITYVLFNAIYLAVYCSI